MTRKSDIIASLGKLMPYIVLVFWLALQLPFLSADPDTQVDVHTRGAWTDEGLYAAQARNIINTGTVAWQEDSLLTRGPLFVLVQLPFFFLFGQSLLVARLIVLLSLFVTFLLFFKNQSTKYAGLFLLLVGFTQFHLFQFSHYAMSEIMGTCLILLSALMMARSFPLKDPVKRQRGNILWSAALLFFAYGLKIQFLYIAFLLPIFWFTVVVTRSITEKSISKPLIRMFGTSVFVTMGFMALYAFLWYLPNQEFYHYVMSREVDSRFPSTLKDLFGQTVFNFQELIFVPSLIPLIISGGIAATAGLVWMFIRPSAWRISERWLFVVGLVWVLLELHKVSMTYMPHRYLLSAYASIGLITATFLSVIHRQGKWLSWLSLILVVVIVAFQLPHTFRAMERRTYELKAVNQYLQQFDWQQETITGAWAGSVAWGTGARTYPVWYGFLNDDKALDGKMIIAETDQEDSDRSLLIQGKALSELSDSVRTFPVWRYEIELFWLKTP